MILIWPQRCVFAFQLKFRFHGNGFLISPQPQSEFPWSRCSLVTLLLSRMCWHRATVRCQTPQWEWLWDTNRNVMVPDPDLSCTDLYRMQNDLTSLKDKALVTGTSLVHNWCETHAAFMGRWCAWKWLLDFMEKRILWNIYFKWLFLVCLGPDIPVQILYSCECRNYLTRFFLFLLTEL